MFTRRSFLRAWATAAGTRASPPNQPAILRRLPKSPHPANRQKNRRRRAKRLAVVTTEWRYHSHAWHMAERFLVGYPIEGQWHHPPFEVVSAYVDQYPENDLSRSAPKEFGFTIYPTIAEALRCGGKQAGRRCGADHRRARQLSRATSIGQTKYPRYEFFKQVTDVFRRGWPHVARCSTTSTCRGNGTGPRRWSTRRGRLGFPFLAGSSLPVTWRMPSIDMPYGAEVEEVMCVAIGGVDSYDFHALETIQCMAERRQGGETGVVACRPCGATPVWKAHGGRHVGPPAAGIPNCSRPACAAARRWPSRDTSSHRYPTDEQIREWVKEPVAYRFEYADGVKATMLIMNGLVGDFTFAARLKGRDRPLSTLFYLPPLPMSRTRPC